MPETSKIYLLTNTCNDKVYVGYTSQKYVSARWGKHKQCSRQGLDTHLYRAMRLYGEKSFSWQTVAEFPTPEEARHAEKLWIILLKANHSDFGYNTTSGGEAPKHTEETKRKIGKIQRDNPKPLEFYQGLGELTKTPERRALHSATIKQAWADGRYANRKPKTPNSLEALAKQSAGMRKAWAEGRHAGSTGKIASAETRHKMSLAQSGRYAGMTSEERKAEKRRNK